METMVKQSEEGVISVCVCVCACASAGDNKCPDFIGSQQIGIGKRYLIIIT